MNSKIRVRNVTSRTRTGCQTCRKRRKRCNEARPVCGGCMKLGLKCTYGSVLKWAASRNSFVEQDERSPGHEQQSPEQSTPPQWSPSSYDFASLGPEPSCQAQLRQALLKLGATEELQHTVLFTLSSTDQEILLKFLTSGYRTLISNLQINNDFLTFFQECEQSFASLWSCLTYQVSMDKEYSDLFDEYYHKCLVLFRKEIIELEGTDKDDAIWFVGSLLCGISANRLLPWTIHVNAMIAFLQSQADLSKPDRHEGATGEVLIMLGSFDLPAYILNRKTDYHRLWARYNLGLPGIDEESGLPCSLIDLLAQLDDPSTIDALFTWKVPSGELVQVYSWDATRYAAILRALEDSTVDNVPDINTSLLSRGVSLERLVKSLLASIQLCISQILPESSHFKQTVVFPLVMAASQRSVLSQDDKNYICSTLESFALEGSYHLRQSQLKMIQDHWINDARTIEETAKRLDVEMALW